MFDTRDELLRQIRLGEDSSLALRVLQFLGATVNEPHRSSMADELAAMANTANGVCVLGVDDKTKDIVGIPLEKLSTVERWLQGICNDLIVPTLFCRIRNVSVTVGKEERYLVRIDVPKSLMIHKSPGGYFHRIGSAKREMAPDVLFRLAQQRSQARLIRFDEQSVNSQHRSKLVKALWEKFRTPLSPADDEEFLLKLKLLTTDEDGNICPSVAGVLMATEEPHLIIDNAYIQAVAYRGTERNAAYQVDSADIYGPLDRQIMDAFHFVNKNMKRFTTKMPARQEIPQYSLQAIFEAIVNAVAHRDYSVYASKIRLHMFSDRLELFSPGSIPGTMTIESMPLRQACRNALVTGLFARCPISIPDYRGERTCIMDRRGEGVPIILTESKKLSQRMPEYRLIDDSELLLTIYAAQQPDTA